MPREERLYCQCGYELPLRPPPKCPRCRAAITRIRRNWFSYIAPLLFIALLFAALIGYALWWIK